MRSCGSCGLRGACGSCGLCTTARVVRVVYGPRPLECRAERPVVHAVVRVMQVVRAAWAASAARRQPVDPGGHIGHSQIAFRLRKNGPVPRERRAPDSGRSGSQVIWILGDRRLVSGIDDGVDENLIGDIGGKSDGSAVFFQADVALSADVADQVLIDAVVDAGYEAAIA